MGRGDVVLRNHEARLTVVRQKLVQLTSSLRVIKKRTELLRDWEVGLKECQG